MGGECVVEEEGFEPAIKSRLWPTFRARRPSVSWSSYPEGP